MIALDVTPLTRAPHSGGARLIRVLLAGWRELHAPPALLLLSPAPLRLDQTQGHALRVVPARSARAFRGAVTALGARLQARAFLSPWQAFPRLDLPTLVWVHELPHVRCGPIEGRMRAWVQNHWLSRNVNECASILVPSQVVRRDVLQLEPGAASRVHVVPLAIDAPAWRRRVPPQPTARHALMVGAGPGRRRAHKKGLDVMLAALRDPAWPGLPLVLVGEPGLPVPAGVHVCSAPDDAQLAALYAQARVVLVPSRSEGYGYPMLEAMACGTPVVHSDGGALAEVAAGAARCVPAGDAQALAVAVAELESQPAERERLRALGWERVQRAAPSQMAAQVLDACRRAMSGVACDA